MGTLSRIGTRLEAGAIGTGATAPRYVTMPAASSAFWTDGRAIDAGTAHIIDNNLSHLASESVRHLAWNPLYGEITWSSHNENSGWAGYEDADGYTAGTGLAAVTRANAISWDWRTAVVDGPFYLIQDRLLTAGGYGPRSVHVYVETDATGDGLALYAALTSSELPPDQNNIIAWDYTQDGSGNLAYVATGYANNQLVLDAATPIPPNTRWISRKRGSATSSSQVQVTQAWLWVGWRLFAVTGDQSSLISMSAFEVR